MTDTPVSTQIYKSRDRIRNQIIEKVKEYMDLENVDLTKSSFLTFLIEILSTNVSNLMFYQMSAYKEFFLTKALLPDSIYNLSSFLGYNPKEAIPAQADILFTIPFGFTDPTVEIILDKGFKLNANDIDFITYYKTIITITNNSNVSVIIQEENRIYNLPITYESDQFLFMLPFKQSSTSIQEFQLDEDLQLYQFTSIEVPFNGQIASQVVEVRPPDSVSYELYSEVSSLYLMDATYKGYISRRSDEGITLQFGNGLIGYQPKAGSTIKVTLMLTEGANGNVITGSINSGERIYNTNLAGITQIVNYEVINTSPAYNGKNEESLEEIRRNAIINITALERIVTENDFKNANIIIKDSPIGQNSLPVLKRSDLKINEIDLFSTIYFNSELVPTKNMYKTFTSEFIPRNTIITKDNIDYYTIFDMEIDILNSSASYKYIMYEIEKIPVLTTSYGSNYDMYASNLTVKKNNLEAIYTLDFVTSESDPELLSCEMEIIETGAKYNMVNDGTSFIHLFTDYRIIPNGELTYLFTIQHSTEGYIGQYSSKFIFILSLDDFTTSNVITDGTAHIVYDIPTIQSSYYDIINQRDFELQVMQQLLTSLTFKDYKMLTDFINFKFSNTTGSLDNMQLNEVNLLPVLSIESNPQTITDIGERYIILNGTGEWENHENEIAMSSFDGTAYSWVYITPKTDQMLVVSNKNAKYIFDTNRWILPKYEIPLQISLDIFKSSTYSGSMGNLIKLIKDSLISEFTDRFGINAYIYRSEIIDVVQSIEGIEHCILIKPESSIFFNFNINNFTQEELLKYSPEYVYFTTDDISIRIF